MTEAMRALDEISEALDDANGHPDLGFVWDCIRTASASLATLRAALAPPADGEVEAIRQRHEEYAAVWNFGDQVKQDYQYLEDAHADRATLLAHVSRLSAELAAERERRVEVEGALKPFAAMVSNHPEMDAPSPVITLTYNKAHLRRAATLTKD